MPGRKATPTALKLIRGNPGKRPLPKNEPTPSRDIVQPDFLSAEAAQHWPIVAQQLHDAQVLTSIDTTALALYCETFAKWRYACDQIAKFGPVVKAPSGFPIQSPFLAIANKAHDQMVKLLVEFGMTPSSRTRVTKAPGDNVDEYSQFVDRRRRK